MTAATEEPGSARRRRTDHAAHAAGPGHHSARHPRWRPPNSVVAPIPLLAADGVARQQPDAGTPVGALVRSVTDLGYRMRTLDDGGNWVASPLSVAYAFAMVRAGADGPTRA